MRHFKIQQCTSDADVLPFDILANGREHFDRACFLNSNNFSHDKYTSFDWIIALGANNELLTSDDGAFDSLKLFSDNTNDWIFGFLNYDLKNQTEELASLNQDNIKMPLLHFFQPIILIIYNNNKLSLGLLKNKGKWSDHDYTWSVMTRRNSLKKGVLNNIDVKQRVNKSSYISNVNLIKEHIQKGDIYEMNYCVEFYDESVIIDPLLIYRKLNLLSPAPFSAFYQIGNKYLICSSPERFLKKMTDKIISQPIKGTMARGSTPAIDRKNKEQLFNDPKERSENVMVVDLVRNDLSKTAVKGSVEVEELYGIYPFTNVHQMISTITSRLTGNYHAVDAIQSAFPMGSMTGTPKVRAMQIIEHYESTCRGVYSGCVGYMTPDKDFDFNVLIRSILYNQDNEYLNFMVGGAITSGSIPEQEYYECLLKAKAMIDVFGK